MDMTATAVELAQRDFCTRMQPSAVDLVISKVFAKMMDRTMDLMVEVEMQELMG